MKQMFGTRSAEERGPRHHFKFSLVDDESLVCFAKQFINGGIWCYLVTPLLEIVEGCFGKEDQACVARLLKLKWKQQRGCKVYNQFLVDLSTRPTTTLFLSSVKLSCLVVHSVLDLHVGVMCTL